MAFKLRAFVALGVTIAPLTAGNATETITYGYDVRGRLITVSRSGTVNNGVQTSYTHDKADNRKNLTTTGSANPPP